MLQSHYRLAIQVLLVDSRRECQYEYYILRKCEQNYVLVKPDFVNSFIFMLVQRW